MLGRSVEASVPGGVEDWRVRLLFSVCTIGMYYWDVIAR